MRFSNIYLNVFNSLNNSIHQLNSINKIVIYLINCGDYCDDFCYKILSKVGAQFSYQL